MKASVILLAVGLALVSASLAGSLVLVLIKWLK
jgi:hypothetical protein